jgi:hypothetical protein
MELFDSEVGIGLRLARLSTDHFPCLGTDHRSGLRPRYRSVAHPALTRCLPCRGQTKIGAEGQQAHCDGRFVRACNHMM